MTRENRRKRRRPEIPRPSEMEWEVLKPLWGKGPLSAREICRAVQKTNDWKSKTIRTMLFRLVKKGALTYEKVGKSYFYRPAFSREKITGAAVQSFLRCVFDGALNPFLVHSLQDVSVEELRQINRELTNALEQRTGSKSKDKLRR